MQERKRIDKRTRQIVYDKYKGHCAYCGCKLEYKDMQVDHIESVRKAEYNGKEVQEDINNYNPACRMCNFYKSTFSVEDFRKNISTKLYSNLKKNFNYRMLLKYGLIKEHIKPFEFYFEKINKVK